MSFKSGLRSVNINIVKLEKTSEMDRPMLENLPLEVWYIKLIKKKVLLTKIIYDFQIILKIFNMLYLNELLTASLVCTQWNTLTKHPLVVKKYMIYIQNEEQMETLLQSNRFLPNIIFSFHPRNDNQLPVYNKFWEKYLNNIEYVCLDAIQDIDRIFKILSKSRTLKTLEFRRINYLFNLGRLEEKEPISINRLLFGDYYFEDLTIPMKILSLIPRLEGLQLKTGVIENSFLLYLRNPEFTSTLRFFDLSLDIHQFSSRYVRNVFLKFFQLTHYDLEHFSFSFNKTVFELNDHKMMIKFFLTQRNLKSLRFLTCGEIVIFDKLITGLPKLKYIGVETQSEIDPLIMYPSYRYLISKLKKFWNLESLEIHLRKYYDESYPIFESLTRPCRLKKLLIVKSDLGKTKRLLSLMKFLTMLTVLKITESNITDQLLQGIFQHLLNLRDLILISREDVSTFILLKRI